MTNFEMVETLRQHANVSYEEAKAALEESNWDLLDAMVLLEKKGVAKDEGAFTTRPEPEKETKKTSGFWDAMGRVGRAIARVIQKGNENSLEVSRKGEKLMSLPVTVVVLLLVIAFWVVVPLLVIGLFTGFHYAFRGPDLEKPSINGAMDKASEFADNLQNHDKNNDDAE